MRKTGSTEPRVPRGIPIVISAPSGAGKSTIAARVAEKNPAAVLSISCTTRPPRSGERDGQHYFFLSDAEFRKRIEAGEFLEWAEVHGYFYGTPLPFLRDQLEAGRDVILTIDPQGAASVKNVFPDGVFIFVVPPSWEALEARLRSRATDDEETVTLRMSNAKKEISLLSQYDYLIVNDELVVAIEDVNAILHAEHRRVERVDRLSIPILSEAR